MGVQGKRPLKKLKDQFKEPDLIVNVDTILRKAIDDKCVDGKGNLILEKIAAMNHIAVVYEDLPSVESGYLRSKGGQYIIGINKKHNRKRQRFTFAHELGHFFLHKEKDGCNNDISFTDELFYRIENSTSIEYAANEFAARLLIPEDRLKERINVGMVDLNELADFFEVSLDAMRYRVISLNYTILTNE